MTETTKRPRRFKSFVTWATASRDGSTVCLWHTRQAAREGCDPDEYVVRVMVTAVRVKARRGGRHGE